MPDWASFSAVARPIPLVAPVMRAVVIGALLFSYISKRGDRYPHSLDTRNDSNSGSSEKTARFSHQNLILHVHAVSDFLD